MLKTNLKGFWNALKNDSDHKLTIFYSSRYPVPTFLTAQELNDTFVKSFLSAKTSAIFKFPRFSYLPTDTISFHSVATAKIIDRLKLSSTCATHYINAKFLKSTKEDCSLILKCIFSNKIGK